MGAGVWVNGCGADMMCKSCWDAVLSCASPGLYWCGASGTPRAGAMGGPLGTPRDGAGSLGLCWGLVLVVACWWRMSLKRISSPLWLGLLQIAKECFSGGLNRMACKSSMVAQSKSALLS
jgi:hypothetical protein